MKDWTVNNFPSQPHWLRPADDKSVAEGQELWKEKEEGDAGQDEDLQGVEEEEAGQGQDAGQHWLRQKGAQQGQWGQPHAWHGEIIAQWIQSWALAVTFIILFNENS